MKNFWLEIRDVRKVKGAEDMDVGKLCSFDIRVARKIDRACEDIGIEVPESWKSNWKPINIQPCGEADLDKDKQINIYVDWGVPPAIDVLPGAENLGKDEYKHFTDQIIAGLSIPKILEERWLPPQGDEDIYFPIRPPEKTNDNDGYPKDDETSIYQGCKCDVNLNKYYDEGK